MHTGFRGELANHAHASRMVFLNAVRCIQAEHIHTRIQQLSRDLRRVRRRS